MNRISYALRVLLRGIPEASVQASEAVREVPIEVVREVPIMGSAEPATVYVVQVKTGKKIVDSYGFGAYEVDEYTPAYYATCEQAHTAHPGKAVVTKDVWRIGRHHVADVSLTEIKIEPKPKRAKGAK